MLASLLHTYALNLGYARKLVADLRPDQMALQPAAGMNHPAWVLGHLALTADMLGGMLGCEPLCPPEWQTLFGMDSTPSDDPAAYPSRDELLTTLEKAHTAIAAAVERLPEDRWGEPTPLEAVRGFLPTFGDAIVFVTTSHEMMHLGQLSAWRRVAGLPRV